MPKVIDFEKRIETEKRKKQIAEERREIAPLLHFLQCACCGMKCWRCGSQAELRPPAKDYPKTPFNFCKDCREEYLEYKRIRQGGEKSDASWRNSEWIIMWEKWIEYQNTVRNFQESKEVQEIFKKLRS
jgi:hypothetical protein